MADDAPVPGVEDGKPRESTGLSILDLVKHASRTILETLGQNDRLGIVTFSDDATVSHTSALHVECANLGQGRARAHVYDGLR
jgi:hypothetical protein